MAHRLATPERWLRNAIWLPSELVGAPVVNVQESGVAMREPSAPRIPVPTVTVKVVLAGSDPDGVKRRIRCSSLRSPAAPSALDRPTLPEIDGVMVTRLSLTVSGSMG